MLENNHVMPSFAVDDIDEAEQFYGQTLGLKAERDKEMGHINLHLAGGLTVMVYPKPDYQPATFTILNFMVKDLDQMVDDLATKGVPFEHYDTPDFKTNAKGIAEGAPGPRIAWFTDPAGNIFSLIEDK